jgi:nitrate/nitrite transporter NarK
MKTADKPPGKRKSRVIVLVIIAVIGGLLGAFAPPRVRAVIEPFMTPTAIFWFLIVLAAISIFSRLFRKR